MQIHDINDYYRPRRFPWLPVALLAALVVAAIVHFSSKKGDPAEETAASEPAAEAPAAGAPNAPATPGVAPAAPSPLPPAAQPAGPALSKAEADAAIAKARQLEAADQIEGARDQLLSILDRVPESARATVQEAVGRLSVALFVSPRPAKGKVVYVVKSGDSLSKIAAAHGIKTAELKELNKIADVNKILVGQKLILPDYSKPSTSQPAAKSAKSAESKAAASGDAYVVKPGDALSKIAAAHGVKTKDLMAANDITDANKIRAGQKLTIPGAKQAAKSDDKAVEKKAEKKDEPQAEKKDEAKPADAPVAPLPAPVPEVVPAPAPEAAAASGLQDTMLDYNVQDGDTVEGIARLFVVSADEIRKVNGLAAGAEVAPGQKIKIPPSM